MRHRCSEKIGVDSTVIIPGCSEAMKKFVFLRQNLQQTILNLLKGDPHVT